MKQIFTGILYLILIILFSSKITLFAQNDQFSGNNNNAIDNLNTIIIDNQKLIKLNKKKKFINFINFLNSIYSLLT